MTEQMRIRKNPVMPPNVGPLKCGRHEVYHRLLAPGKPDHRGSVAPRCSAASFGGFKPLLSSC